MSEEEAISELEGYILNHSNFHEDFKEAIDTILDLYNKEKEKNKKAKIIADSFHEKMAKKFDEDFIPKSKIKEIIGIKMQKNNDIIHCYKKKYGKDIYWYDEVQQAYFENRIYKELLEELLEENNKKVKMNITKILKHIPILDFDDIDEEENKNE